MMTVYPTVMTQDQEDLFRSFSTTLNSLSVDAEAVRQLTSLAKLSGVSLIPNVKENMQTNTVASGSKSLNGLHELDHLVTSIEQKVAALRQISSEEKRALDRFQDYLKVQADDQASYIQEIRKVSQNLEADRRTPCPQASNVSQTGARRDTIDPRTHQCNGFDKISIKRIASIELQAVSRSTLTLGRISLLDLNEALEEIERVCQKKISVLPSKTDCISNSLQRRYEYLKQHRVNGEVEVEAHAGHCWVSEQELREDCVFFRNGESTARAILSILRLLKRLKQVPGKNMEITYICMTGKD